MLTDRLAPEKTPRKLTAAQVERIAKTVELIQADAATVYQRPG